MKILFLDDERWRHDELDRALEGHEIHHVYTVRQFRSKLDRQWDLIMLDHDLGDPPGNGYGSPPVPNGCDAARLLVDAGELWKPTGMAVIHSWNAPAADRMAGILRDAGWPFMRHPFGSALLETFLPALGFVRIRDTRAASG